MIDDITDSLNQTKRLFNDKDGLFEKLNEAIMRIKNGSAEAAFLQDDKVAKILTSGGADQTYRNIIESMLEGVVILHSDGIILFSNFSFAKMLNLPKEKVIGTNLRHFIPNEFAETLERFFEGYPDINSRVERVILTYTGVDAYYMVSLNKLKIHNVIAVSLVWRDVTNQEKIEAALIAAHKYLTIAIEDLKLAEKKHR